MPPRPKRPARLIHRLRSHRPASRKAHRTRPQRLFRLLLIRVSSRRLRRLVFLRRPLFRRKHRTRPHHVGPRQRQNRKRSPTPPLQSGLHVPPTWNPAVAWIKSRTASYRILYTTAKSVFPPLKLL